MRGSTRLHASMRFAITCVHSLGTLQAQTQQLFEMSVTLQQLFRKISDRTKPQSRSTSGASPACLQAPQGTIKGCSSASLGCKEIEAAPETPFNKRMRSHINPDDPARFLSAGLGALYNVAGAHSTSRVCRSHGALSVQISHRRTPKL